MIKRIIFSLLTVLIATANSGVSLALSEAQIRALDSNAGYVNTEETCEQSRLGSTQPTIQPGLVYVLGDSISDGARGDYRDAFSTPWSVFVDAEVGRPLSAASISDIEASPSNLTRLERAAAVVVELGANNLSGNITSLITSTTEEIRFINPTADIYWVDIGSNADGTGADGNAVGLNVDAGTPSVYSAHNQAIYANASQGVSYRVVPWFEAIFGDTADPTNITASLVEVNNFLSNDELHPNSAGSAALAQLVAGVVVGSESAQAVPGGGGGAITWPADLDPEWIRLWTEAGELRNVDPKLIAAIFTAEHGGRFYPTSGDGGSAATGGWRQPSSSTATGPFQILNGTYDGLASQEPSLPARTDRGPTDPRNNSRHASVAAAVYISNIEGVPGLPAGSGDQPQGFLPRRAEIPYTAASVGIRYNQGGAWHDNYGVQGVNAPYAYADQVAETYILLGGQQATDAGTLQCANAGAIVGTASSLGDLTYFSQRDSAWGSYGHGTIRSCGCGPTSMAMIISTLTDNTSITPQVIADFGSTNGHQVAPPSCGSSWSLFAASASQYGLTTTDIGNDYTAAAEGLRAGGLIVASVRAGDFTSGGHIIVLRAVTADGNFLVGDPNDGDVGSADYQRKSTTEWSEAVLTPQVRNMFLITN